MNGDDTIAAISSAAGAAARMIVRTSGPKAWRIAESLCPGAILAPAHSIATTLRVSSLSLPIHLYAFRAPHSYSGEDLIEFHIPGNPLLARMLLDAIASAGARPAEPGEFTARAYFHGRLDLTEAEGVAATIAAHSEAELRAARQLLAGELARRLRPAMDLLADTLALVEVGIDFTEEDVSFLSARELEQRIKQVDESLDHIVAGSARFEKLAHEPHILLAGRPNAGKSTLLNALAGRERAVVSPIAGTTRDAIWAEVFLRRGIVRLIDVAGLDSPSPGTPGEGRGAGPPFSNPNSQIEGEMQSRALRELESADLLVLVHDGSSAQPPLSLPRRPDLIVLSKSDLPQRAAISEGMAVSARTGERMEALRSKLDELAFGAPTSAPAASLALNGRHLQSIGAARDALSRTADLAKAGGAELIALELREALDELGRILGSVSPDDLLGRIFSTFCIGK
jgi:tRNA modification GTPase